MQQIDLEPGEYRSGPLRQHPLDHMVFKRAATVCALWFFGVALTGRSIDHGLSWPIVAVIACMPAALLAFIVISLDD